MTSEPGIDSAEDRWSGPRRSSRVVKVVVAAVVLVTMAVLFTVHLVAVHQRTVEESSVSYKYGQHLMIDDLYDTRFDSARVTCTVALRDPPSPPVNLDTKGALDGCVEEEQALDN